MLISCLISCLTHAQKCRHWIELRCDLANLVANKPTVALYVLLTNDQRGSLIQQFLHWLKLVPPVTNLNIFSRPVQTSSDNYRVVDIG